MLAVVVTVDLGEAELIADRLWSMGVGAVEERPLQRDPRRVELWTSFGDDEAVISATLDGSGLAWRVERVDDGVMDTWRAFAQPTWVDDDLVVHPAWQDAPTTAGIAISIDPASTFGMGDHPTTVLTMRAMRRCLRGGDRVLDVGCGSGVLAVAACLLGAGRADGVDIAADAPATTMANAARNGVADRIAASNATLGELTPYDVVVANILAPALIDLADDLVRLTRRSLVISGVLADRHQHVLDALRPLRVVDRQTLDGWAAVTLAA